MGGAVWGGLEAVVGSVDKADTWAVVQGVQSVLEAVHETTGLPWWATLMVGTLLLWVAGWKMEKLLKMLSTVIGVGCRAASDAVPVLRLPDPSNAAVEWNVGRRGKLLLLMEVFDEDLSRRARTLPSSTRRSSTRGRSWYELFRPRLVGRVARTNLRVSLLLQPPNDRTAHLQAILLGRKGMKVGCVGM